MLPVEHRQAPQMIGVHLTRSNDVERFLAIKQELSEKMRIALNNPKVLEFLMQFYQDHVGQK